MIRKLLPRLAPILVVLLSVATGAALAQNLSGDPLIVATGTGEHAFEVEIADEPEERSRGLMYRRSLAPGSGMLFDFEENQPVSMWMENTYIPLDMIFIREGGTVHRIARDTTPLSRETVESRGPVRYVLEIAAGGAARIGLKPGDEVRHPVIGED